MVQLQHRLKNEVVPWIDVSDIAQHAAQYREVNALSRALAAFSVMRILGWTADEAAASVTDGSKDGGIDAIAVDSEHGPRLVVVQSKWVQSGSGSASKAEMLTFKEGVDRLIHGDRDYFSEPIQNRWSEIESVIYDPQVRIDIVFAHTGSSSLAEEVESVITPLLGDLNEHQEVAKFVYLDQASLHAQLQNDNGIRIDLDVELSDFEVMSHPAKAFYGHVHAGAVAEWKNNFGDALFASNLRSTLPDSSVNEGIFDTLKDTPEKFWYFNNGITALCNKIEKAPAGPDRRVGMFRFSGVQIVNGAQTVGSIARASNSGDVALPENARVMVRFIDLEQTDSSFASDVTRWTNTQNRVGGRDFLALDPEQTRIASEFDIDGKKYVFRSGQPDPEPANGCGVQEATVALACVLGDVKLAVQSKREVSRLWADIEKAPYKILFNPKTTSQVIWRSVEVLRIVDSQVAEHSKDLSGRHKSLANYLNRIVFWTVAKHCSVVPALEGTEITWAETIEAVKRTTNDIVERIVARAEEIYPGYPANLSKNTSECSRITTYVLAQLRADSDPGATS